MFKRVLSLLMVLVMLIGSLNAAMLSVSAASDMSATKYTEYKFTGGASVAADMAALIETALTDFAESVDVSVYNFTYKANKSPGETDDVDEFIRMATYEFPMLFQLKQVGYSYQLVNGVKKIVGFRFEYKYSKEEYNKRKAECRAAIDKLVDGIKGNNGLDDVTKALLLHDRIIERCEYDRSGSVPVGSESTDIYGTLVKGKAICQGYTRAYIQLLREIGIDSYVCESDTLNHAWNVVWINGRRYHVDVTNDDPVYDVTGNADHRYFLRSTGFLGKDEIFFNRPELQNRKVGGKFDYQYTASNVTDTTYDTPHYWHNSTSVIQYTESGIYYIYKDEGSASDTSDDTYSIRKIGKGKVRDLPKNTWKAGASNAYWTGNFSSLASDGKDLFYSVHDRVYKLDPSGGSDTDISKGTDLEKKYNSLKSSFFSVIGITYRDGYLICDLYNRPVYENEGTLSYQEYLNVKNKYRVKLRYDTTLPEIAVSASGDVAAYHTVTLDMSDNGGIAGYYWGKNAEKYVSASLSSATVRISDSGVYYFKAVDAAGNISAPVSMTFFKIKLYTMGGKCPVTNLVVPKTGKPYTLPTATRSGYEFNGWSKTDNGADPFTSATANANITYYASWTKTSSGTQTQPDGWINPFNDVKNGWYYNAVAYCAQRGYMNGMSENVFSPGSAIKREQFAQILANLSGIDTDKYKYADSGFSDVKTGKWYSGAIAWGRAWGYIAGVSETRFGLGNNITRAQIAQLLYAYGKAYGKVAGVKPDTLESFTDKNKVLGTWAENAMKWAVGAGIISGVGGPVLSPNSNASRAQAAQMMMQFDLA